MFKPRFTPLIAVLLFTLLAPLAAQAQSDSSGSQGRSRRAWTASDRLFLGFIQEATIVDRQWWEGQLQFIDADLVEANLLRGTAAFQPWEELALEIGGTFGFGDTDIDIPGESGGRGGTDFELWGKYQLGQDSNSTQYFVGGSVIVPTGDESAGLGNNAFALAGWVSMRYSLPRWTFMAHLGLRINGDAEPLGGAKQDGETSALAAVAMVFPFGERFSLVAELDYEGERYDNSDDDFRGLAGMNWHVTKRGSIRAALSFGLSDGAPDLQVIAGYATMF